jgi:hypothetical protein
MCRLLQMMACALPLSAAAIAWTGAAFGQTACSVEEKQRVSTVTGRFSVGSSLVTVTIPNTLYPFEPTTAYLQTTGSLEGGLRLESGASRVAIADGAPLRLTPQRNQRLSISLTGADGQPLCTWIPRVATAKRGPSDTVDGFAPTTFPSHARLTHTGFLNCGDPILLGIGGRLASESAEFTIDGHPMTVLARSSSQVVLHDPHPALGMRTIESRGDAVTIPMLDLQVRMREEDRGGRASLEITVTGRDRISIPTLPRPRLLLYSFDPGQLKVRCGRPINYGDPTAVPLENKGGLLVASCRVDVLKQGPLKVDGVFLEFDSASSRTLPSVPRLPAPWPRR